MTTAREARQRKRRGPGEERGPARSASASRRGRRPDSARQRTGTRPSRRKAMQRRWVALLAAVSVIAGFYLVFFTSLLGVRTVDVLGATSLSPDQIRAVANVPDRRAMLRVDTDEIRDRVLTLPGVATADVSRSWPSTIEIEVSERTPIGFFNTGEEIHLVDDSGFVFKKVPVAPAGLPELKLARVGPDDPPTRAATTVLVALPQQLRTQIASVGAESPGSVRFDLNDGRQIRWGDARPDTIDRKTKVLAALLTQPGKIYDVSSPELPTVS
ncbi:cell division protein FtsQ/DivIB [Amycolatopsis magusensis]|uniref:cell division protein FtsQ/DivIB n=1 Tax=Amycolatopsis magusensis TaxID=882444 RepID=UPI00378E1BEB